MKKQTYLKYRKEFINQYEKLEKNELGFVRLKHFKIRNFKVFIFLFSLDFIDCYYTNLVRSVEPKRYWIRNRPVTCIKINSEKSMFDRFKGEFEKAVEFYNQSII